MSGEKIVRCPSLYSVSEAVDPSERGGVLDEEDNPVCTYGEEEPIGNTVA